MKNRQAMLAAFAATATLTSVAATGPDAAKQRVALTTQAQYTTAVSPAVFTPIQLGALKRDSGTMTAGSLATDREVTRNGQRVDIVDARFSPDGTALWVVDPGADRRQRIHRQRWQPHRAADLAHARSRWSRTRGHRRRLTRTRTQPTGRPAGPVATTGRRVHVV
jgi:hypothetical protein